MSKETYAPWDTAEILKSDKIIAEYLRAALEENDPAFFVKAVGNVARAKGMSSIAQEAQLGRQNLYKALSGERDPRLGTLMKVLDTFGVRLTVALSQCEKEIDSMCFRDANCDPEALHRRTIRLLEELARRTGLKITEDRVLEGFDTMRDGRCLHRPRKIAEKIRITTSDWHPNPAQKSGQRLCVSLWPAETVAQANRFCEEIDRKAFLDLNKQGWEIRPNSGFHFARTPLFGSGTSLNARRHLEYFFSGNRRPYGRYYFPGNGRGAQRELTPPLLDSWQRDGVISTEARAQIEHQRDNTERQSIDLKPGFWVYRIWELSEVFELEDQGKLEAHIIQALAVPLATWSETLS